MRPTASADLEKDRALSARLLIRLRRLLRPPRLLSLTRAGKFFILLTLGVGFAAINTGNNLLFLLFGMLLSLIVASGLLSEAVLRHVGLRRKLPQRAEAGFSATSHFIIENRGWWPALSIEASEQNPRALAGPISGEVIGPRAIPWWKFWRRQTDDERRPLGAAYCLRAPPESDTTVTTHYEFPRRGLYELSGLQLKTRFPFGLFEKTRRIDDRREFTVFPAARPAEHWLGKLQTRRGDRATLRRGWGEEFFGLRDYRPGEDQRLIHWKSTARRGKPLIRETEAETGRTLLVILDNRFPGLSPTDEDDQRFEVGISRLSGLFETLARRGYHLHMVSCEGVVVSEAPAQTDRLNTHLATIPLRGHSHSPPQTADLGDTAFDSRVYVGFSSHLPSPCEDVACLPFDELNGEADRRGDRR